MAKLTTAAKTDHAYDPPTAPGKRGGDNGICVGTKRHKFLGKGKGEKGKGKGKSSFENKTYPPYTPPYLPKIPKVTGLILK